MKDYKLSEFLEGYNEQVPQILSDTCLLKLIYTEHDGALELFARSNRLVPFADVSQFERSMCEKLGLKELRLRLKYTPDMLCAEYFQDLTQFLKSRFPVVNGFFEGADISYSGGLFTVGLKHGGADILKKAGIESAFPALVFEMFSISVRIELTGITQVDTASFAKQQEDYLNSIPINNPLPSAPAGFSPAGGSAPSAPHECRTCNVECR